MQIKTKDILISVIGSIILAFGLYNIHSVSNVTEGGVLGATLLIKRWFHISPAVSGAVLNIMCYALGVRTLGKKFIFYSLVSTVAFSVTYAVCELFPPLFPSIAYHPFIAAIVGALFVGVGVGLCVRVGGAPGGDDALAMSLSEIFGVKIETVYLISDLTVLLLSLTYIPFSKIAYSLLTVILSGQIVGFVQRWK